MYNKQSRIDSHFVVGPEIHTPEERTCNHKEVKTETSMSILSIYPYVHKAILTTRWLIQGSVHDQQRRVIILKRKGKNELKLLVTYRC